MKKIFMKKIAALTIAIITTVTTVTTVTTSAYGQDLQPNLSESVQTVMGENGFVSLGAAIITSESIEGVALGKRIVGTCNNVTYEDKYHIGSCGKAMTATMIGLLVARGDLQWTTKPSEVFPDLAESFNEDYSEITLEQLLHFDAGVPAFDEDDAISSIPDFQGTDKEKRRAFVDWVLSAPPAVTPGTFLYSNASISIAAAMAEEVTGQSWEALMNTLLFQQLGITPVYGLPTGNQPWGHVKILGILLPIPPCVTLVQIPTVLKPSGDISLSIGDWAKFVQLHLRALRNESTFLPAAIAQKLHTPTNDYAMGWIVHDYMGSTIHWHDGTIGTFYSYTLIRPEDNKAYVVVTNSVIDNYNDYPTSTLNGFNQLLEMIVGEDKFFPLQ